MIETRLPTDEENKIIDAALCGPNRPACWLCEKVPPEGLGEGYYSYALLTGTAICSACFELSGGDLARRIDAALRKAAEARGKSLIIHREEGLEDGETWGRCVVCCVEGFNVAMAVDLDWKETGDELFCLCLECASDQSPEHRIQVLNEADNALEAAKGRP
jgi:hypothetical protein